MATLALKRRTPSLGTLNTSPLSMSTIDAPLPSASVTNKPAGQTASLYHTCRSVLDKLAAVEGMAAYLDKDSDTNAQADLALTTNDPLSQLWSICRRGTPLCILFNALCPDKPLNVDSDPNFNQINTCKASVYHFIVACLNQLEFSEEDVFTITDLYQNDTNGFVKVVNTVNKILDCLEAKGVISVRCCSRNSGLGPEAPKDTRDKVILELLETERKYVQDLEVLQNYMRELQNQKILPLDTIHYLFGNLNALVDFQRRFLIRLEGTAENPAMEQRFGQLFVEMESAFAVYEPYCANYHSAQELVVQEASKLQKVADILNPTYELPSMLIKPVQRICKYPLLLSELIKSTNKDWPHCAEMEQGLEAIKRVTEGVNETQRKHENDQALLALKKRIDSWKGQPIDSFGSLLLHDKLHVTGMEADEEHSIFFFEKALLFCKENKDSAKNKLTKSNTISIKKKRRSSLQRKGQIFTHQITGVQNVSQNGGWALSVEWKTREVESILLKFRHEEQLHLWETTLTKVRSASATQSSLPAASAAHVLPVGNTSFLYEEDEEEDEDYLDEEDDDHHIIRSRSSSFFRLKPASDSPKSPTGISLPSARPLPGMNLMPLPRVSSSAVTSSPSPTSPIDYAFYPISPPPSHPSSPTTSSRMSTNMVHPHRQRPLVDNLPPFADHTAKCVSPGIPTPVEETNQFSLPVERTQSQSGTVTRPQVTTRGRSQSSPHLHKGHPVWDNLPQIPFTAKQSTVVETDKRKSMRTVTSTPGLSDAAASQPQRRPMERANSVSPLSPGSLRVKLNCNDGVYVILAPVNARFVELMESVERKIRLVTNIPPQAVLRLKYQDEDGDYITINSDDDVQMAFENHVTGDAVNLFVSV